MTLRELLKTRNVFGMEGADFLLQDAIELESYLNMEVQENTQGFSLLLTRAKDCQDLKARFNKMSNKVDKGRRQWRVDMGQNNTLEFSYSYLAEVLQYRPFQSGEIHLISPYSTVEIFPMPEERERKVEISIAHNDEMEISYKGKVFSLKPGLYGESARSSQRKEDNSDYWHHLSVNRLGLD